MPKGDSYLAVAPVDDPTGVEIIDQIERRRYTLHTSRPVSPTAVPPDQFTVPVREAVEITTSELVLPRVVGVYVRDETQSMIAEVEHLDSVSLPDGRYTLELSTQIKTYLQVDGPVEITADITQTRIEFEAEGTLTIGARSRHKRPAATITTTESPHDMMQAIEAFGSALKPADPERSYPTLRGHPPAVELGETLDIPDGLQSPDTGITLELPPNRATLYVAAPLAFYLGANLVPGHVPRLTTDAGFEYTFRRDEFEADVERVLKQVFFLDCVTRTEGLYELELHERAAIEPHVDLDFDALYDKPLAEQVATYLDVPFGVLKEHIPEWRLTAHVESKPATIEQLPFVVDDLAVVRTATDHAQSTPTVSPEVNEALTRDGIITRSTAAAEATDESFVQPEQTDALEEAWIGDSIPIGASKLTKAAFENRLERETTDGNISINIVVNDSRMNEERALVDTVYGDRDELPFDVTVHRDMTVGELRELLTERTGFLHYIGHTEHDGVECADGKLNLETVDETGVDAFLLNSCNSYNQGLALIEAGAIGGIVTLNEVVNDSAVEIGESIAHLLNSGFPLRAALTIAREENVFGGQYIVVGDGGMTVTQSASRTPQLFDVSRNEDRFAVRIQTYATDDAGLGSLFMSFAATDDQYRLSSGEIGTFNLSRERLQNILQMEELPLRTESGLRWSSSVDVTEL